MKYLDNTADDVITGLENLSEPLLPGLWSRAQFKGESGAAYTKKCALVFIRPLAVCSIPWMVARSTAVHNHSCEVIAGLEKVLS